MKKFFKNGEYSTSYYEEFVKFLFYYEKYIFSKTRRNCKIYLAMLPKLLAIPITLNMMLIII